MPVARLGGNWIGNETDMEDDASAVCEIVEEVVQCLCVARIEQARVGIEEMALEKLAIRAFQGSGDPLAHRLGKVDGKSHGRFLQITSSSPDMRRATEQDCAKGEYHFHGIE